MMILKLKLSSFRLSASTPSQLPPSCQLRFSCSTNRLRGVESPVVFESPQESSSDSNAAELVFPSSFSVSWTETLPDHLALRAAVLRIDAVRQRKSRVPSILVCAHRPVTISLGTLCLDLSSLLYGTVCHSLRLRMPDDSLAAFTLSFDAIVEQPCRITFSFSDLLLQIPCDHDSYSPSVSLKIEYPWTKRHSTSPSIQFTLSPIQDTPILTNHSNLNSTDQISTDSHKFNLTASWPALPSLDVQSRSLFNLAHSSIKVSLINDDTGINQLDSPVDDLSAQILVPMHHIWGAFLHPGVAFRHSVPIHDGTLTFSTTADGPAPSGQLVGGVTTDESIVGASTVIFGSEIRDDSPFRRDLDLPAPWIRLSDSFGLHYFRNSEAQVDVWTTPTSDNVSAAIDADNIAAQNHGLVCEKKSIFRDPNKQFHTWIHPDVSSSSLGTLNITSSEIAPMGDDFDMDGPPSGLTSFSLSTLDACDLNPAAFDPSPEMVGDELDSSTRTRSPAVEMRWSLLPRRISMLPEGVEGHTFTAINNGTAALRFAGSTGIRCTRTNILQRLDSTTLRWENVEVSGVAPEPRTGHGAVALGTDKSRVLIFGGTSSRGARNDMHTFHTESNTWSPVVCTGMPPAPRARLGMTVTSDGTVALVFGGRSLYRWLGGKYYDPLHVHTFHAERSLWIQMQPRGSGERPAPRSGCAMQFLNGRHMVIHGGFDEGDNYFDDTFVFDLVSSSWVALPYPDEPTRPTAREDHASTVIDENVMVVCGGDGMSTKLGDVHLFDGSSFRWVDGPSIVGHGPGRIVGAAMATLTTGSSAKETVVLCGGEDGFNFSRNVYSLEVSHRSAIDVDSLTEMARLRGPQTCVVCLDAPVNAMFVWCGHSVCCRSCAWKVYKGRRDNNDGESGIYNNGTCPLCRQGISKVTPLG